jgi:hypothetical protein
MPTFVQASQNRLSSGVSAASNSGRWHQAMAVSKALMLPADAPVTPTSSAWASAAAPVAPGRWRLRYRTIAQFKPAS